VAPDGAQRNPGTLDPVAPALDFAALHPGYKKVNRKTRPLADMANNL
jgi:hypothetical protein